ncbi:hypothetical protein V8F33_006582 [Rhypophila sp. PSN 637]
MAMGSRPNVYIGLLGAFCWILFLCICIALLRLEIPGHMSFEVICLCGWLVYLLFIRMLSWRSGVDA